MIVKFLGNKKGGSSKSINYLLDKNRVQDGTAKILRGDENQTRLIIDSLTKKQKVSFGVMSFEERHIDEKQKQALMDKFEKTFFAGLEKEQYNILWVEHTDKGRLELNCIIPKVELSTGRSFNPYNHKTDLHIKDLFTKEVNLFYGYSSPNDPAKKQSVQGEYKKTGVMKDYAELDKLLHKMVSENTITSRAELIGFLKDNNVEVPREGKDYISVKLDNKHKAKRLKGGIYANEFKDLNGLTEISRKQEVEEREYLTRDTRAEHARIKERYIKAVEKRSEYNKEFYSKQKQDTRHKDTISDSSLDVGIRSNNNLSANEKEVSLSSKELEAGTSGRNTVLHQEGELDDEFRESITRGIETRERTLSKVIQTSRNTREEIHDRTKSDIERLYPEARGVMQERANRRTARELISGAVESLTSEVLSIGKRLREWFQEDNEQSRGLIQSHQEHIESKNSYDNYNTMSM